MHLDQIVSDMFEGMVIIGRPVETVFGFYRDFRNLPRFLGDVVQVELTGDELASWTARTPFGFNIHWPVRVTEIRKNAVIAYEMQSVLAPVRWHVAFTPVREGAATMVRERVTVPAGKVAERVFKVLGKPSPVRELEPKLLRLKELLETGRVTTTDNVIAGRR